LPRRCPVRFASRLSVLVVAALALASCAPPIVPAPLSPPQPPFGRVASPAAAPAAPVAATRLPAPGPPKVALLVPLSGANAQLGQAILDAAQLALFEAPGERLTLVPRDTGGNAEGAAKAARAVIADGVQLILGPLLAAEVEAVKPIARDAHLNVIAFSTVTELAGGNLFLMGFLPRQEVVREVGQAREHGFTRFAALAPNSPYGHLMADALRDVAATSGAVVTRVEFYDPRAGDTAPVVQRLLPGSAAAATEGEGSGAPSFDALLLPEGGARLKEIAREVKEAEVGAKPAQLLGSGLWDVPDIGTEPALVGGWFAASPPETRQTFAVRFRATYAHDPPRLASLGYDAAALAAVLAQADGAEPFSQQALLNPNGFTGVDGLFRFTPGGLVQRGLAVLEVGPQGDIVISPAPQSFQDIGY
jgi:branched-chain amino acid transport system substrate-binding protein